MITRAAMKKTSLKMLKFTMSELKMSGIKKTGLKKTVRPRRFFHCLVAACLVPLLVIGGPGSPVASAWAATKKGDAQVSPSVAPSLSSQGFGGSFGDTRDAAPRATRPAPNGIATSVRPSRVLVVERGGKGPMNGALLIDGDSSTTLSPESGSSLRLIVEFSEPVWLDGVSVFGERAGELRLLQAKDSQALRAAGTSGSGWRRFGLEQALWGRTFHFDWTPGATELPGEWAFWQRGSSAELALGGIPQQLLAVDSFRGGAEHAAVPRSAVVSHGTLGSDAGAKFQFALPELEGVRRAFVVYELEGAAHFSQVRRSVNGLAPLGQARFAGGKGGLQVEEIPIAGLRAGANELEFFPASPLITPEYRVRDVKVVTVGAEQAVQALRFHSGEAGQARTAQVYFDTPVAPGEVAFFLRHPSDGKLLLRGAAQASGGKSTGRGEQLLVELSAMKPGWHTVALPSEWRALDGLEAALSQEVRPGAISEVLLSGLAMPQQADGGIVLSYPQSGECFDGHAVVRGFIEGVQGPRLTANGQPVDVLADGSFELFIDGNAEKPWELALLVDGDGGAGAKLQKVMQPCLFARPGSSAPSGLVEDVGAPFAQVVSEEGGTLEFAGARLEIPEGALTEPTRITIRPLPASEVRPMNPGMTNVTPRAQAYSFGPHGLEFQGPVQLTLPYDEGAVPAAASDRHIAGYFFDETQARWVQVGRAGEATGGRQTSFTHHFTDFINATIATPDAPGGGAFAPTGMGGISAGDPLAGVNSIAPPSAHAFGSAAVSLPFELPPGRAGMTPSLALTYDSGQQSGWVGYGWQIAGLSKIELDTRFGVPDYDQQWTQAVPGSLAGKLTYALDGAQLTEVGSVSGGTQFRRRVEGSFQHIVQLGSGASKYFEVTAQDGTKYTYGKSASARVFDPLNPTHIFGWHLELVRDVFGNQTEYEYVRVGKALDSAVCEFENSPGPTCAFELVPKTITYVTHANAGNSGRFAVEFVTAQDPRNDARVNGRAGFLTYEGVALERIDIDFLAPTGINRVRSYVFEYVDGDFHKLLLQRVAQQGTGGQEFTAHSFSYERSFQASSSDDVITQTWVDAYSPDQLLAANANEYYSLSQRNGWNVNISGGVSFGLFDFLNVGVSVNTNGGSVEGSHSLVDISGDGLPDYLDATGFAQLGQYDHGTGGLNLLGTAQPYTGVDYDDLDGAGNSMLGLTVAGGVGVGASANAFGFGASGQVTLSTSMDFRTLADMDGDGFTDRVEVVGGDIRVYRNRGSGTDSQTFRAPESWGSMGIHDFVDSDPNLAAFDADVASEIDPLVRWIAPRAGSIQIGGPVRRLTGGVFGARTTIYRFHNESGSQNDILWDREIEPTDTNTCVPSASGAASGCGGSPLELAVAPGDSIFFLLHPRGGSSQADPVQWQPTIAYTTDEQGYPLSSSQADEIEPYGRPIDSFSLVGDFRVASGVSFPTSVALTGTATLGGTLTKGDTADEVRARIVEVQVDANHNQTRTTLGEWVIDDEATTVSLEIERTLDLGTLIDFELSTDGPIDPSLVYWEPHVRYSQANVPNPFPGGSDVDGAIVCTATPGGNSCSVQGSQATVPLPASVVDRKAPVSFTKPFSTPTDRTRVFRATGGTVTIAGTLDRNQNSGAVLGICQAPHRLLWKERLDGSTPQSATIDETFTGLSVDDFIVCSVRSEGASGGSDGTLDLVVTGATPTEGLANIRSEDPQIVSTYGGSVQQWQTLSGGFHGWSFGDWDSSAGELQGQELVASNLAVDKPKFFPASPGQQDSGLGPEAAWRGRGGAFVTASGVMQAGILSANDGLDGGGYGFGAFAARISHSFTYGGELTTPALSIGAAESHFVQDRDLIDINGDNLPDNVTNFGVSYNTGCTQPTAFPCQGSFTNNNGQMGTTPTETWTKVAKTRIGGDIFAAGGDVTLVRPSRDGVPQAVSSLGLGLGTDHSRTVTNKQLIDINGDGLPDYVLWNHQTGKLTVRLNLGYSQTPDIEWATHWFPHHKYKYDYPLYPAALTEGVAEFEDEEIGLEVEEFMDLNKDSSIAYSEVTTITPSIGGSVSAGIVAAGGGAAYQHSLRRDLSRFVDVTGDGLPDHVVAHNGYTVGHGDASGGYEHSRVWLHVKPNLGTVFGPRQVWNVPSWQATSPNGLGILDMLQALNVGDSESLEVLGVSQSSDWTAYASFNVCILFFCISGASSHAQIDERSVVELQDVNGDRLPDFVMKQLGSGETRAKLNKLGGVNLLTKISGPAGRITTIHYGSEGATHDQPGASYVMRRIDVEDGQGNTYVTQYEYGRSGNTDRDERQFLGYGEVSLYRPNGSSVRTLYSNTDFYRKGLPVERTVNAWYPNDSEERTLLKETFDYEPPVDLAVGGWHHPYERTRTTSLLEEQPTGPTTTETRTWDPAHGNLTSLRTEGDEPGKTLTYYVDYTSPAANVIRPSRVRAVGSNGVTYRYRRATYGSLGELVKVSDYNTTGNTLLAETTITSRDMYGNPLTIQDPTGGVTSYEYEEFLYAHVTRLTDPFGLVANAVYDLRFGLPTQVWDANGSLTSWDYDAFARLTSYTGPLDQGTGVPTIVYEYGPIRAPGDDFQNDPVWVKRRHKDVSQNLPAASLSGHDFIEVVAFSDGLGRVIQTKKDLTRDTNGTLEVGMTVSGKTVFDDQGRPAQVGQPLFSTAPATQFVAQATPLNPTIVAYDDLDRVVTQKTPLDDGPNSYVTTTTTFGHQPAVTNGVLKHLTTVQVSDDGGPVREPRHILRDADGEIAEIYEYNQIAADPTPVQLVTSYSTNAMNELETVVDPGGNTTTTLYDALGRKRQMTSPDMGLVKWTYRPDGQVATVETAQLRAKGQITTYQYDLSRLVGVNYQDANSTDITFTYGTPAEAGAANGNLAGHIKSQTSESGMKEFQYDAAGNVSREVMTLEHKVDPTDPDVVLAMGYRYDSFGRMLETRYLGPDREVVSYVYDEGGSLQSVFGQRLGFNPAGLSLPHHTTYLAHRGYNEFGQVVNELAGNLIPTKYTYGARSRRLTDLERSIGQALNQNSYTYDAIGNIVAIQNSGGGFEEGSIQIPTTQFAFSYDNLDQLRTATGSGNAPSASFGYAFEQEYDELGNIILKDQASFQGPGGGTPTTPVNAQTYRNTYSYFGPVPHAPSRIQGGGVATDYQYDPSGNRQQSNRLSETRQLTWTEDDRLRSIKRANEPYDLVRNYYDAQGQKTISLHPGATSTEEVFHAGALTLRADGNSYAATKHIYAGGQRLASKMDHRWFTDDPVQYYATDHLGSTNFTFDSEGNVLSHTEYFPSGEIWRSETLASHSGINQYQFTGKEWDDVTGLYDFGFRSYDPVVGQWLSPDPAFDGLNLYAYVHNNPVNLVDPFGLSAEYGRDNPIPVADTGLGEGQQFFQADNASEAGFQDAATFDRNSANSPVYEANSKGLTPGMAKSVGEIGAETRDSAGKMENGGLGAVGDGKGGAAQSGQGAMEVALVAAAVLNMESGSAIRTDGTGSPLGMPGGMCDSCTGSRLVQFAYLFATAARVAGGGVLEGMAGVYSNPARLYHFTSFSRAERILSEGTLLQGGGLYGPGVYLTRFDSRFLATLQGAASTQVRIPISTMGRPIVPTVFPGTYRHLGNMRLGR